MAPPRRERDLFTLGEWLMCAFVRLTTIWYTQILRIELPDPVILRGRGLTRRPG
jgi:hypothetical protein